MGLLKCSHMFTDNMVLQRRRNIKVWGIAAEDATIKVKLNGIERMTKVCNHEWSIVLPPMEAGGPYKLEVSEEKGEKFCFNNVMIGEVWLAGGQSNMEFELKDDLHGKEALSKIEESNVRYFYVKKNAYMDEFFYNDERDNSWMLATAENATCWSAVGYYFAREIAKETGVTVGIIGCNWGGTSASNWMSKKMLESDADTSIYSTEYDKLIEGKTQEDFLKELKEYKAWQEDWNSRVEAYYAANPRALWDDVQKAVGECNWKGPIGPKSEYRPYGLYETMLKRVIPYSLAGFIYYQGESDDHRPQMYYQLLRNLITQWRNDWEDDKLPFLFVQLPMHTSGIEDKKNWCLLREAQMRVHNTVANTGIAVVVDCGEYNNIHPINKKPVGKRLALQALCHVYGLRDREDSYGPVYNSSIYANEGVLLHFDYARDGFIVKDNSISGFEIAGEDKVFFQAEAEIKDTQIWVSSSKVTNPKYVRYLWTNYSEVVLFGKNGLPVAPFRTSMRDEW